MCLRYRRDLFAALMCLGITLIASPGVGFAQSVPTTKPETARAIAILQDKINKLEARQQDYQEDKSRLTAELNDLNQQRLEVLGKQDALGISNESFAEVMKSLQLQRVELMIDLAGLDARRATMLEAREEMIAKNSEAVVSPLVQILELEKERFEEIERLHKSGATPQQEYRNAQRRLLEAQVRLAEANRPPADSAGLNDGLLNASLDRAEKQARLEKTETLLNSFAASRKLLEESANVDTEYDGITRAVRNVDRFIISGDDELRKLRQELDELMNSGPDRDDY